MSFAAVGAGIAAVSAGYGIYTGERQRREGRRLQQSASDPGFQVNQALVDNARVMQNRYGNYTIPGYDAMRGNIGQAGAQGFDRGVQGASSGQDVLDLAARIAYGQQEGLNQVEQANAVGRDQALLQSLDANALAGQQYQMQNEYDRQRYMQQLQEAAALQQAGAINTAQGIDSLANIGSSYAMSQALQGGNAGQPDITVQGQGSIFNTGGQQGASVLQTPASNTTGAGLNPYAINRSSAGVQASNIVGDQYRQMLRESLLSRSPSITPLIRR